MNTITFIEQCLIEVYVRLTKSMQGLTREDFIFRPAPHANCIAEVAFHLARAQDRMVAVRAGLGPELWESQKWFARFGYPRAQSRSGDFRILRDLNLTTPDPAILGAYLDSLHENTCTKVRELSPEDLDRAPDPAQPEYTLAVYFRHLIVHCNNHHGQIDYIRGLLQEKWDLPPGTGIILK
ncbi:DinB family protein [Thermodesulfobacteriota bacterium]